LHDYDGICVSMHHGAHQA